EPRQPAARSLTPEYDAARTPGKGILPCAGAGRRRWLASGAELGEAERVGHHQRHQVLGRDHAETPGTAGTLGERGHAVGAAVAALRSPKTSGNRGSFGNWSKPRRSTMLAGAASASRRRDSAAKRFTSAAVAFARGLSAFTGSGGWPVACGSLSDNPAARWAPPRARERRTSTKRCSFT